MILYGPKFFSDSFLEGLVDLIFCFDEYTVTDFEVQCWSSSSISRSLVLLLRVCHFFSEELVEGVEVNGILSSLFGGKVSFWMYREVWMVAFVGKEGGDTSGSIQSIVVRELH